MLIAQRPEIETVDSEKNNRQKFSISPLEPGFGYTFGNSLRRILLSSLGGAAITSVKFQGVSHEFSTIPGIREDVTDIILNLKDVVVKSHIEEAAVVSVDFKATGAKDGVVVTAKELDTNANIEIFNPDQPIATLNSGASFAAEFTIEPGRGYVPAGAKTQSSIGQISIDAIFSPIRRVSVSVEPVQVEESTEYDRLILDVTTDGTITPKDALASAASTLKALSTLIEEFGENAQGLEFAEIIEEEPQELARSILELELSERAYNCLVREDIGSIGELILYRPKQLLELTNFGQKSLDEVIERLDSLGLALAGTEKDEDATDGIEDGTDAGTDDAAALETADAGEEDAKATVEAMEDA